MCIKVWYIRIVTYIATYHIVEYMQNNFANALKPSLYLSLHLEINSWKTFCKIHEIYIPKIFCIIATILCRGKELLSAEHTTCFGYC